MNRGLKGRKVCKKTKEKKSSKNEHESPVCLIFPNLSGEMCFHFVVAILQHLFGEQTNIPF